MTMTRWANGFAGAWGRMLVVLVCMAGHQAMAQAPAATTAAAEPDAKALLMGMAKFLAATPRFSVNLRNGYDVPQASGQTIEFNEKRTVTVSRPDKLRIAVQQSDGDSQLLQVDGKNITLSSSPQNVYGQVAKPGTIDDAVIYFLRDLRMRLPLAVMITNQLPAELERRVQSVDYVEATSILGVPAHHLAARTETVDFQVWVTADSKPLPLRVVLTYKTQDGQPQFWADFADWNLAPAVTDATFAFTAPPGAQKIPFLTQLPQLATQGGAAPKQTGE